MAKPWIAWTWLATGTWYDFPSKVYFPSRIRFGNGKRIGVPFRPGRPGLSAKSSAATIIRRTSPAAGRRRSKRLNP